jgi:beta-lactamase regulating signal transducer with metallopeptidase domain
MKDVKEEAERWARYQRFAEMKGWTEEEQNANYPSWQRRQRWMAIRNEWTRDWMLVGGLTFFLGPIYVFWFWMNGEQWTDVAVLMIWLVVILAGALCVLYAARALILLVRERTEETEEDV